MIKELIKNINIKLIYYFLEITKHNYYSYSCWSKALQMIKKNTD